MSTGRLALVLLTAGLAGCSAILDFDDETDLPCPCLPSHTCLRSTNRCVPKHSSELFKSCSPDADSPDDLCPVNARCINLLGRGHRCLPKCEPTNYSTPESGAHIREQCAPGNTCWPVEGGGVCDEGVCNETRQDCTPPNKCVAFNGAGICFTPCSIYRTNACLGDEICHPIGASSETACIKAGQLDRAAFCSFKSACRRDEARPMVCDRPDGTEAQRQCWPICRNNSECIPGEQCQFARPNIDEFGANLGLCITPGGG